MGWLSDRWESADFWDKEENKRQQAARTVRRTQNKPAPAQTRRTQQENEAILKPLRERAARNQQQKLSRGEVSRPQFDRQMQKINPAKMPELNFFQRNVIDRVSANTPLDTYKRDRQFQSSQDKLRNSIVQNAPAPYDRRVVESVADKYLADRKGRYNELQNAPQTDWLRNRLDANTDQDKLSRFIKGDPELYRDEQTSMGLRARNNIGEQLGAAPVRLLNTYKAGLEGGAGLAGIGYSSLFDSDEKYNQVVGNVEQRLNKSLQPDSGLLGHGTMFNSPEEAQNISAADLAKRIGAYGVENASMLYGGASVGSVLAKAAGKNLSRKATQQLLAKELSKQSGAGFTGGAAEELGTNANATPQSLLIAGGMGAVADPLLGVGAYGLGRAGRAVGTPQGRQKLKESVVPKEMLDLRKQWQKAYDVETNPTRKKQIAKGLDQLNAEIRKVAQGGFIGGEKATGFNDAKLAGRDFVGVDGKPRFEVDDSGAKLKQDYDLNNDNTFIGDILDHTKLYKQYPGMKDVPVRLDRNLKANMALDDRTGTILINPKLTEQVNTKSGNKSNVTRKQATDYLKTQGYTDKDFSGLTTKQIVDSLDQSEINTLTGIENPGQVVRLKPGAEKTLMHELQHEIQGLEGFAKGDDNRRGFDNYNRSAGEAEARAVAARMNMTDGERYVKEVPISDFAKTDYNSWVEAINNVNKGELSRSSGPVEVVKTKDGYKLIEGNHRAVQALEEGKSSIPAKVLSKEDAEAIIKRDGPHMRGAFRDAYTKAQLQNETPKSTFYDSLDVPKQDLIVRDGSGKAMSVDPNSELGGKSDYKPEYYTEKEMQQMATDNQKWVETEDILQKNFNKSDPELSKLTGMTKQEVAEYKSEVADAKKSTAEMHEMFAKNDAEADAQAKKKIPGIIKEIKAIQKKYSDNLSDRAKAKLQKEANTQRAYLMQAMDELIVTGETVAYQGENYDIQGKIKLNGKEYAYLNGEGDYDREFIETSALEPVKNTKPSPSPKAPVESNTEIPEKYIKEYADILKSFDDDATGGQMIPDGEGGYKRISEHSQFYRDYFAENGRKPTKEAWLEHARKEIQKDKGFLEDVNKRMTENQPSEYDKYDLDNLLGNYKQTTIEKSERGLKIVNEEIGAESKEVKSRNEIQTDQKPVKDKIDGDFVTSTNKYLGRILNSQTQGRLFADSLPKLNKNQKLLAIQAIDSGKATGDPTIDAYVRQFKNQTDGLYARYADQGVKMGYVDSYLPRIYKNPETGAPITKQEYDLLQLGTGRTKNRTQGQVNVADLRFKTPEELLGHYTKTMEKVVAGRQYLNNLEQSGHVTLATERPPGMKLVDAEGFVEDGFRFYAKPEIADSLNKIFGSQSEIKGLRRAARVASVAQDIGLSGGLPGTPLNAFSFAQLTKEVLAGNFKGPAIALSKSFKRSDAADYFRSNAETVGEMQKQGIAVSSEYNLQALKELGGDVADQDGKLARAWDRVMSDPTFKRMMPILQVEMYKNVKQHKGADVAAQTVKNFYGLNDLTTQRTRSRNVNNALTVGLFAPKYRESMVKFWIKNAQAVRHPLDPSNRQNLKFVAGATLLFGAMQAMNVALNGVPTWDNPDGKKDKLLIPGMPGLDGKVVGLPFLSSIATVPRNIAMGAFNAATGNFEETGKNAKSFISYAGRPVFDLMQNENYFGQRIVDNDASSGEKLAQGGSYLTEAYMHPYIREGVNLGKQQLPESVQKFVGARDTTVPQSISQALEAPARFYDPKYFKGGNETVKANATGASSSDKGEVKIGSKTVKNKSGDVTERSKYDAIEHAYSKHDGKLSNLTKYDSKKLSAAIEDVTGEANTQLQSMGLPEFNSRNSKIANIWAKYKNKEQNLTNLEKDAELKKTVKSMYRTTVGKEADALLGLNDGDIRKAVDDGLLTQAALEEAIAYDDFLFENGLSSSLALGKTIRKELGVSLPPSYATRKGGGGRGGRKGSKGKKLDYSKVASFGSKSNPVSLTDQLLSLLMDTTKV